MSLDNAALSELLARAAQTEQQPKSKALRRAARSALMWPEEAAGLLAEGRLTELRAVGPWVAQVVRRLLEDPPGVPEPDPLRAGFITLARARAVLAENPSWLEGLQGDHQMHTTYSDGGDPIEAMAEACEGLGYRHCVITDHSKGLKIAGGMDEATLARQAREVAIVNDRLGPRIRVLHGLEMNVSVTGDGDMDPSSLEALDLVLGAFHSKLRVMEDQTERYLAAIANPTFDVLAHPRCRIFNFRAGLWCDWRSVLAEAAAAGKAFEIDAYPDRQDLDVESLRIAREEGTWISIGTDAHSTAELGFMEIGLAAAILAGIPRERILNFLPAEQLRAWRARRLAKASSRRVSRS